MTRLSAEVRVGIKATEMLGTVLRKKFYDGLSLKK